MKGIVMRLEQIFKYVILLLAVFICILSLIKEDSFAGDDLLKYENYRYRVTGDEITIVDYGYDLSDEELMAMDFSVPLVIPSRINGMKVVSVEKDAFVPTIGYSYKCKTIKVSDYMSTVDLNSFNALSGLKKVALGKYTRNFVSYGRYRGTVLEISKIAVPKNAKYLKVSSNGALYSKDGKILYAVPQKKKGSFAVSSKTKTIFKYAFCYSNLRTIKFPKSVKKIYPSAFTGYDINSKKTLKVPRSKVVKYKKALKASGVGLYGTKIVKY